MIKVKIEVYSFKIYGPWKSPVYLYVCTATEQIFEGGFKEMIYSSDKCTNSLPCGDVITKLHKSFQIIIDSKLYDWYYEVNI